MKIVTIVGARPQFVKAAVVSRLLRERHTEVLAHTGPHSDDGMSAVSFGEPGVPAPEHAPAVGSGSHGAQTGLMLERIEQVTEPPGPASLLEDAMPAVAEPAVAEPAVAASVV